MRASCGTQRSTERNRAQHSASIVYLLKREASERGERAIYLLFGDLVYEAPLQFTP